MKRIPSHSSKVWAHRQADCENWLPVPGFESLYAASDAGRIKSLRNGRVMSPGSGKDGYPIVSLYRAGKRHGFGLHRLVALTFHPQGQNQLHREVAHLDGSRTNCRADNLKWVSRIENLSHRVAHGTLLRGETHPRAKLTDEQVREIRSQLPLWSMSHLARVYGVSPGCVRDIKTGRIWRHVQMARPIACAGDSYCRCRGCKPSLARNFA